MNVETVITGYFEENCYIAINPATMRCVVVDPGADAPRVLVRLCDDRLEVDAFLLTHGHMDHISALAELSGAFPEATIYLHPDDAAWCFTHANSAPGFYPTPKRPPHAISAASDGMSLELAGARWTCLATPGHTPGGVCWRMEPGDILFSGDTLFRDSIGRTDLPGGNAAVLAASLKKLTSLQENLTVYPGHGSPTTLDREKKENGFLR